MKYLIQRAIGPVVLVATLLSLPLHSAQAAAFTAGNVVVYRVGSGTGSAVNTGNPVFLDEYTAAGTLVQSVAMPTTASGLQLPLVASGTATSEGLLTRSADGRYLLVPGYGTTIPYSSSIAGSTATAVPRVIGRVDSTGTVDTSTGLTDWNSGNNPRSATSVDGTTFWGAGGAGINYAAALGATTSAPLSNMTPAAVNARMLGIIDNQLYVSSSSTSITRGIATVGTGLPTSGNQTYTILPGMTDNVSLKSPHGFFFCRLSGPGSAPDTLYVCDDTSAGAPGGINKFSLVSGSWVSNGTTGTAGDAYRGICGVVNGANVTLYATRKGGQAATGGGELVTLVDSTGYNGALSSPTITLVATATANTAFRGVAMAPVSTSYTVTYDGNGNTGGTAPSDSNSYSSGATVTVLGNTGGLSKTGYNFAGWNTAANGTGTAYNPADTFTISSSTTLYAQWTLASTYAVTYNGNGNTGGTEPTDPSSPYSPGATVTVLANTGGLVKIGYSFTGWNTAADGSGTAYSPNATFAINQSTVLFAQWTINSYSVTYNGNGNTGGTPPTDPSSPYIYNTTVTVLAPGSLIKSAYDFAGWNTASDGSGTSYNTGGTFAIVANVTLYAQWTITPIIEPFTPGNLAVFAAASASANNTTFSILEVNPSIAAQSTPVQTIPINGTNGSSALRTSGSASSTGYLADSDDGTLVCFSGHNTTNSAGNANSYVDRGAGTLDSAGTFALKATYTGTSGQQTRSATTADDALFYVGDQGGIYTNSSTALNNANARGVKSFGGTLYVLRQSTVAGTVVVATLSADGTTLTPLPGLANDSSAQDFCLISSGANGAVFDVLYITEDTSATVGMVSKYSLVSGTWTANGTYATTFGGFGLCAATNSGGAALYVTTGTGASANNSVLQLIDAVGYNAPINITTTTTLYTAAGGTTLKGIAFAPTAAANLAAIVITSIQISSGDVLIDFTADASETINDFTVLSSESVVAPPPFAPVAATITTSGPGQFRATLPVTTPAAYYQVKR